MPAQNFSQKQQIPCHSYEIPSLTRRTKNKGRSLGEAHLKLAAPLCNLAARRARQEMEPMQYREPAGGAEAIGSAGEPPTSGATSAGIRDFRGLSLAGGTRVVANSQSSADSPASTSALSGRTMSSGPSVNVGSGPGLSYAPGAGRGESPQSARFGGGVQAARVAYYLPVDVSSRFGARLRELRRERNMTQLRMATDFGIDRSFISDVERGRKSISLPMLEVIALGLGLSLSDLLSEI